MQNKQKTAAFLIIGNEILSGRTIDKNLNFLAKSLVDIAIDLVEVRVVKDIEMDIVFAVNELRVKYDYVFTSGGIGPTHDDITALSVAKALGVKLYRDDKAKKLLQDFYPPEKLNDARLKMADVPQGSVLLNNPVSSAPGFKIDNVFVFAGVPKIMQAMFFAAKEFLNSGVKVFTKSVSAFVTEGDIAASLSEIQDQYNDVDIGSYPYIRNERLGTSLVFRSTDGARLDEAYQLLKSYLNNQDIEIDITC